MGLLDHLAGLNPLARIQTSSLGALTSGSGGNDFRNLLGSALEATNGKLFAQLANIIMLKSVGRGTASPEMIHPLPSSWLSWRRNQTSQTGQTAKTTTDSAESASTAAQISGLASDNRQKYDDLIAQTAQRHGLDVNLVRAVVTAESDFDPNTVSSAGAMGLMQLMPGTARDLGVSDPFDPTQNIEGGARYLSMMLERFDGDENKALAAYNWGPSNVEAGGRLPAETRRYLEKISRFKNMYAQSFSTIA